MADCKGGILTTEYKRGQIRANRAAQAASSTIALTFILFMFLKNSDTYWFEWQGPSRWFIYLDRNDDGEIALSEWLASRPRREDSSDADMTIFDRADCDNDRSLSWGEYFNGVMKPPEC